MGTNENVKNVNEIENGKVSENTVNTGGQVSQDTIDLQATQRLDFLGDFMRESKEPEKENQDLNEKLENQQGNFAPENAQAENLSAIENSNEIVQENPNEEKIINTQEPEKIDEKNEVNKENAQVADENPEEVQKKKEKQHAQDKKDFRLERMLFARINVMQGKIKESLELIQKFERINAKEENLPNIVTTLHDKLTQEVIKQFRTVGIEFNMNSYLVQSVVSDLLNKFEEGVTEFKDCSENLNFVREVQEDFESRVELVPTSKVKTIFARIRGIFKPERKQERLEELERERQENKLQEANIHLLKYKYINSELEKYTIKDNIVNSLTKEIMHGQGFGATLSSEEFIEQKITPEMKKLGLDNQLPNLRERMYEEYKQRDASISKEDFEKMSVGEIRRNMKVQSPASKKITQIVNDNNIKMTSKDDDEVLAI
ncbi:MAG: hypothetical protein K6B70_04150 [Clostridia bacterium]|nr:hypothetical protein [Clostridia bacterium]